MGDRAYWTSGKPEAKADAAGPVAGFGRNGIGPVATPQASSGHPLDGDARTFFQSRFAHDFSHVRVHTDTETAALTDRLGAVAFTIKNDVFFGHGRFAPKTEPGRTVLAHELAHVVQQRDHHAPAAALEISQPGDHAELEADQAAALVLAGGTAATLGSTAPKIYRLPPQQPTSGPPGGGPVAKTVFLDNNVFLEIGRGNEQVARNLRAMATDPQIRVVTGRGVYTELTRVPKNVDPNEAAAYRAMVDKLHVEVLDAGIAKRIGTYETYAQYEQGLRSSPDPKKDPKAFERHGEPSLKDRKGAKKERDLLKDIPHIAEAKVADAELWTHEPDLQQSARALDVGVAQQSGIKIPEQKRLTSVENILRLVPEVSADDLPKYGGTIRRPPSGPAGGSGPGGGGSTSAPASRAKPTQAKVRLSQAGSPNQEAQVFPAAPQVKVASKAEPIPASGSAASKPMRKPSAVEAQPSPTAAAVQVVPTGTAPQPAGEAPGTPPGGTAAEPSPPTAKPPAGTTAGRTAVHVETPEQAAEPPVPARLPVASGGAAEPPAQAPTSEEVRPAPEEQVGGLGGEGSVKGAGALEVARLGFNALNAIAEGIQASDAQAEWDRQKASVNEHLMNYPSEGALVVFSWSQAEAPWFSPNQPGRHFEDIEVFYAETYNTALGQESQHPPVGLVPYSFTRKWIAPRAPGKKPHGGAPLQAKAPNSEPEWSSYLQETLGVDPYEFALKAGYGPISMASFAKELQKAGILDSNFKPIPKGAQR